jgi:CheY-like chemotaxis protein
MQLNTSSRVADRFWGVFAVFMKVLVAEDEPLIRLGMTLVIEEAGYQVVEVGNTDDALRAIESEGDVGLLLTDVDMPGSMDGIRLAHTVRRRWPTIQLIVVSGKVGVRAGELPEGARFLSKPYQEPKLLETVKALSEAGRAKP